MPSNSKSENPDVVEKIASDESVDKAATPSTETGLTKKVEDLEVKDAQLIFHSIWHELEQEVGVENLHFPAEIF